MDTVTKLYIRHINMPKLDWLLRIYFKLFGVPLLAKRLRYKHAKNYIADPMIRNRTILDAGSGIGDLSLYLSTFSPKEIVAIDLNEERMQNSLTMAKDAGLNMKFLKADVTKLTGFNKHFDGAFALDIIEHLKEDKRFVQKIHEALKPGGFFILSAPSLFREITPEHEKNVGHVRKGYSFETINEILDTAGFKIEKFVYKDYFDWVHKFYSIPSDTAKAMVFVLFYPLLLLGDFMIYGFRPKKKGSLFILKAIKK